MTATKKKTIRCAIYTRKSCEEGLEQEFNSLDAQREACESYIKSQQHEGWTRIDTKYDDGGFSGGTLERPALKRLFEDIEAGEIDTVVVYKIDRLTRALMDFSKIVELFDKKSVSFVSITQQFNTTTSMGRLTLNILLSFAQFEREVTGERIRDKIAASKKKGMWMSGMAPIGYELQDKKLVIDENNARKVRLIFNQYLHHKRVGVLKLYLEEEGIKTKAGKTFTKGHLYSILQNKAYIGMVTHKENAYQGEHKPIIENEIFEKVQQILEDNRIKHKNSMGSENPSLLAGKLFDDKGNYMSPSHSNTRNRRYRYYISQALIQYRKKDAGTIAKIPAGEIEDFVVNEVSRFVFDARKVQKYIENFDVQKQKDIINAVKKLKINNKGKLMHDFIRTVISRIILYKEKVDIILCQNQLIKALESITYETSLPETIKEGTETPILISRNIRISAVSNNGSVLIISDSENHKINHNSQLIKAVVKSYYWNDLLISCKAKTCSDIQKMENEFGLTYIKNIISLRFLAPDIIEKILNGKHPRDLTIVQLLNIKTLDWNEQKQILNL